MKTGSKNIVVDVTNVGTSEDRIAAEHSVDNS
jgi:hypothetical protein